MSQELRANRVYGVLVNPKIIAGVEYNLMMLNIGVSVFATISLHMTYWFLATILIHLFLKGITRNDPLIRKVYIKYIMQSDRYEPWPRPVILGGKRCLGFDRENVL